MPTDHPVYFYRQIMAVLGIQREGFLGAHNRLDTTKACNKPMICFADNRAVVTVKATTVPIRLTQTPARCRVRPRAGIKVGIGRRLNTARDAEERAERVERVETPVEAERKLIEVGL